MAEVRKTGPQVVELIDELLDAFTEREVAGKLNELGHRNWRGDLFTAMKVTALRRAYGLRSHRERLSNRGLLTGEEVARQLGVSVTTVHDLGRKGLLKRHMYGTNRRCLYEPPGAVKLVAGVGGRYGSRPAYLIPAQDDEQGAS
ncbi:helix-turn-helix domain-containing protein [Azohydromonas australica]|uniref:helix-turn-helix domain-containing protein n=1 Tax=Azohydromonas australica TaxID=364039 RepID=UPI0012EB8084|nr:helix-turn-helix domain-containing protein [Azohydromonas australica]